MECYGHRFDWIVIDSPPVLEVTDACLFARGDARVVLVVAGDCVGKDMARAAVDQLVAADADFAGVVLSRVETTHGYYSTY
jgi:Mrp family chromosome partitioning ATPase